MVSESVIHPWNWDTSIVEVWDEKVKRLAGEIADPGEQLLVGRVRVDHRRERGYVAGEPLGEEEVAGGAVDIRHRAVTCPGRMVGGETSSIGAPMPSRPDEIEGTAASPNDPVLQANAQSRGTRRQGD